MSKPLTLAYPDVLRHLGAHLQTGRTESRAFLAWFLENYYRLEETDAQDCVCDGPDDRGIDGVYVDDGAQRIEIFQSKLFQNTAKTLGDTALKEFSGTLDQFRTGETVRDMAETTSNKELKSLITEKKVAEKIVQGYDLRGVFITNSTGDPNAQRYLAGRSDLILYDEPALQSSFISMERKGPVLPPITFDVLGYDCPEYKIGTDVKVIVAPLSATDLVRLSGISTGELFAWNVRQSLGTTKVNKDIAKSILSPDEHKYFLLYHNGLTVLCESVEKTNDKITINGYNVVNGCQSLTSLHQHRSSVSGDLRILTRLIQVAPESELAAKITHHSNNQNGISARDLQSNNALQVRLQNEFATVYGGRVFYRVKRGEQTSAPTVIDNELAARILLAFDLKEPWSCHQTYRLFDELHARIFGRPSVNARRIYSLYRCYEAIVEAASGIDDKLFGAYGLTKFYLLYLLREALDSDPVGQQFVSDPVPFVRDEKSTDQLLRAMRNVIDELVIELNGELKQRSEDGNPVDYKRELKSPNAVRALSRNIVAGYQRIVKRGRVQAFANDFATQSA